MSTNDELEEISVIGNNFKDDTSNKKSKNWLGKLKKHKGSDAKKKVERRINGYLLGETLGMGGYSKVKLGLNEKTNETVALKVMFADVQTGKISDSKKKQLTRELTVMSKVKHHNVIQLIEFDDEAEYPASNEDQLPCILVVLEFAPGGELFDYLMFTGKFDEKATRTYFHQFLDGLEAIHDCGICHRDLKPENLLLDGQCNLKIADFGFATEFRTEDGMTKKMTTACGTKGYLSPELLKGKKYTHKCDIFAVGIIMFTTYAGFPPFQNAVESDWWWDKLSKGWKYLEQSKRLKNVEDIEKHVKASKVKKDLFWKAHERSCKFTKAFKYLIEYTLHPMASCRYDIKHIRKDKWFMGEDLDEDDFEGENGFYDKTELRKFLLERVDKVKKERVGKIMKQLKDNVKMNISNEGNLGTRTATGENKTVYDNMMKEIKCLKKFDDSADNFDYCNNTSDVVMSNGGSNVSNSVSNKNVVDSRCGRTNTTYKFTTKSKPSYIASQINYIATKISASVVNDYNQGIMLVSSDVKFDNNSNNSTNVNSNANNDDNDDDDDDDELPTFSEKAILEVKIYKATNDNDNDNDNESKIKDNDKDKDKDKDDDDDEDNEAKEDKSNSYDVDNEYLITFTRMFGSHHAFRKLVETFYYDVDTVAVMKK